MHFITRWDSGKTYTGSEQAVRYGENILVVCQKSKVDDWVEHFRSNYKGDVIDLTSAKVFKELDVSNYFNKVTSYRVIYVINYDLMFRRTDLLKLTNFTLLIDESSEIENEQTKRFKFINKMKANHVILLSGTPVNGKYEKLWSQVHLLGWEITKPTFLNHYCIFDYVRDWRGNPILGPTGYPIKKVVGYKNQEHLKRKLRLYGADFLLSEEVIDLPKQNDIVSYIEPTKEYKKFLKDKIITIDDEELVGDMPTKKYLYSRLLCGALNPNKVQALKDLIHSTEDRLIIFYNFNKELEAIKSIIPNDRPISECNGHVKNLENYENCDNSITLVQYQSGAMGLNLQKSNKIIYFSITNRCGLWSQSLKRIHRIGQDKPCFYYYLVCGVEKKILETIKQGRDYTLDLFNMEEMKNE